MNSLLIDIIGYLAGVLIIISLIPQLTIIIIKKDSRNVSIATFFILFFACVLWTIFGAYTGNLQILITNVISGFISFLIINASIYFRYRQEE